jgi:hypothetical protein
MAPTGSIVTCVDLVTMRQLAEAKCAGDDWTGLKDQSERRRLQTRLALRSYRMYPRVLLSLYLHQLEPLNTLVNSILIRLKASVNLRRRPLRHMTGHRRKKGLEQRMRLKFCQSAIPEKKLLLVTRRAFSFPLTVTPAAT